MTGWRIGYVVSAKEIITKMAKLHRNIIAHPTSIAQMAALAALTGPQDNVRKMLQEFDRRRIFLLETLERLGIPCPRPKGAFYLFPSMREFGNKSDAIAESLANEGVVTVPGSAFGACGEGHLRISYAASMEKLNKAAKAMERWVKSHRKD
jgi:aminotransferase